MRLPFVSRTRYEAVYDLFTVYRDLHAIADRTNSVLLAKYHALRLAGHTPPPETDETEYEAGSVDDADKIAANADPEE